MKNLNANLSKKHKVFFIFLLILGNALMALLSLPSEQVTAASKQDIHRPDYIEIKVRAKLRTQDSPELPVTLLGNSKQLIIKDSFILKKYEKKIEQDLFTLDDKSEVLYDDYLVAIPKNWAILALEEKSFEIYPNNLSIKAQKRKRKNYEIHY